MDWQAIGAIGEILGAVAVVISLAYLARQIRTNTKTIKTDAMQKAVEDRGSIAAIVFQKDLAYVWRVGLNDYESLLDDEKTQFNSILLTMISSHMGLRGLHEDGSLDEGTFSIYENDLACVMLCPGAMKWWNDVKHAYLQWGGYIDGLLSRWEGAKAPYTESFPFLKMDPSASA